MRWFISRDCARHVWRRRRSRSTSVALASGSACGPGQSTAILPGASGHSCGAPACSASRASMTGVSSSYSTSTSSAASCAASGALGDHHRDRLADMHDALAGERRPVRHDELGAVAAGTGGWRPILPTPSMSLRGQHARPRPARCAPPSIDADDAGEGVRRAHEIGIGLVRQRRIGDVAAVAAHQWVVLDAAVMLRGRVVVGIRLWRPSLLPEFGMSAVDFGLSL